MKCTKCGVECTGWATGNPEEDICSDCAFFPHRTWKKKKKNFKVHIKKDKSHQKTDFDI